MRIHEMIQSSNYVILKAGDVTKIVVPVTKIDRGLGRKWSCLFFGRWLGVNSIPLSRGTGQSHFDWNHIVSASSFIKSTPFLIFMCFHSMVSHQRTRILEVEDEI